MPGLALILLGLIFFLGNLVGHWSVVVLAAAGVGLVAASLQSAHRRFATPGFLALAVAVFLALLEAGVLGSRVEVWLLLLLAGAFGGVFALRRRGSLYPLAIAAVLVVAAADGLFGFHAALASPAALEQLSRWWPLLVILLGVWLLLGVRSRPPASRLVGPSFLLVFGVGTVLAVPSLSPASSWAPNLGPSGLDGAFYRPTLPGRPPWSMFQPGDAALSEALDESVDAATVSFLSVANEAGSTRIYRVDGSRIEVHATKRAWAASEERARQELQTMALELTTSDGRLEVSPKISTAVNVFPFHLHNWMDLEVGVPPGVAVQVTSKSGRVKVDAVAADVTVVSSSGKVELEGIQGSVQVKLVSGDLRASNIDGEVSAASSSGNLEIVRAAALRDVTTVSGRIVIDGPITRSSSIRTSSGDVRLFAPPNSAFRVDYVSNSGKARYDLPLVVETSDKHRLVGSYGQGSAVLTIRTVSGDLRIMRSGS